MSERSYIPPTLAQEYAVIDAQHLERAMLNAQVYLLTARLKVARGGQLTAAEYREIAKLESRFPQYKE